MNGRTNNPTGPEAALARRLAEAIDYARDNRGNIYTPGDIRGMMQAMAESHEDLLAACEAWTRAAHAGIDSEESLWRTAETLSSNAIRKARGRE